MDVAEITGDTRLPARLGLRRGARRSASRAAAPPSRGMPPASQQVHRHQPHLADDVDGGHVRRSRPAPRWRAGRPQRPPRATAPGSSSSSRVVAARARRSASSRIAAATSGGVESSSAMARPAPRAARGRSRWPDRARRRARHVALGRRSSVPRRLSEMRAASPAAASVSARSLVLRVERGHRHERPLGLALVAVPRARRRSARARRRAGRARGRGPRARGARDRPGGAARSTTSAVALPTSASSARVKSKPSGG